MRLGLGTMALIAIVALPSRALAGGPDPDPDPWFGKDKALHFGVSAGLALGGYAVGTALVDGESGPLLIGAAVSVTAGIGKECLDLAGLGDPSWKDLTWDALGTLTGLALGFTIAHVVKTASPRSTHSSPFVVVF